MSDLVINWEERKSYGWGRKALPPKEIKAYHRSQITNTDYKEKKKGHLKHKVGLKKKDEVCRWGTCGKL